MKVGLLIEVFGTQAEFARFLGVSRANVNKWNADDDLPELYELRMRRDHALLVKAIDLAQKARDGKAQPVVQNA